MLEPYLIPNNSHIDMYVSTQEDYIENSPCQSYLDPIYGEIFIDKFFWDIIETPHFKRLKCVKQLGGAYLVFDTATHTRYEHCIGTWKLSRDLLETIKSENPEINFERNDMRNIMTAALCHDLGHGPFSHTFDNNFFQVKYPDLKWSHEEGSIWLFEHMIENNKSKTFEEFDSYDIKQIEALILGDKSIGKYHSRLKTIASI